MLQIERTASFDRQLKRLFKKHYRREDYRRAVTALAVQDIQVLRKMKDHPSTGDLQGFRELHITSNWLLLYAIDEGALILVLTATGTHDDLYK